MLTNEARNPKSEIKEPILYLTVKFKMRSSDFLRYRQSDLLVMR